MGKGGVRSENPSHDQNSKPQAGGDVVERLKLAGSDWKAVMMQVLQCGWTRLDIRCGWISLDHGMPGHSWTRMVVHIDVRWMVWSVSSSETLIQASSAGEGRGGEGRWECQVYAR